ncbi:MAG TPA: hypothetical protein VN493_26150 [Thermoanaerobaculia bacterium]|nr:hypothetical protein [Thermoanaerobaculia bacterium]
MDEEFSQLALLSAPSSNVRFRYSSPCAESACLHWQGQHCAALDEVRAHLAPFAETAAPSCAIRPQCRWHQQAGDAACAVCPLVITDLMAVEEEMADHAVGPADRPISPAAAMPPPAG